MKKKGQLFAQPFIIIFALIVAVLTVAWGTSVILDLKDRADFTEIVTTIADIRDDVNTYFYLEQGSSKLLNYIVPSDLKCICFKDQSDFSSGAVTDPPASCDPKEFENLKTTIRSTTTRNVFLTPINKYKINSHDIEKEILAPFGKNPLCIPVRNQRFKAIIENQGTHVEISRYCKGEAGTCQTSCSGGLDHIFGNYHPNLFDRLSDISPQRMKLSEADKL